MIRMNGLGISWPETLSSASAARASTQALRTALVSTSLGFDRRAIVEVIQSIERPMFFKSMTTFADHRVWQDVYRVLALNLNSISSSRLTWSRSSS